MVVLQQPRHTHYNTQVSGPAALCRFHERGSLITESIDGIHSFSGKRTYATFKPLKKTPQNKTVLNVKSFTNTEKFFTMLERCLEKVPNAHRISCTSNRNVTFALKCMANYKFSTLHAGKGPVQNHIASTAHNKQSI